MVSYSHPFLSAEQLRIGEPEVFLGYGDWRLHSEGSQRKALALYKSGAYGSCKLAPGAQWKDKATHVSMDTHPRRPELDEKRASAGRGRRSLSPSGE